MIWRTSIYRPFIFCIEVKQKEGLHQQHKLRLKALVSLESTYWAQFTIFFPVVLKWCTIYTYSPYRQFSFNLFITWLWLRIRELWMVVKSLLRFRRRKWYRRTWSCPTIQAFLFLSIQDMCCTLLQGHAVLYHYEDCLLLN